MFCFVTFFCLAAEPQPDSGVRCCRGHQNVRLLHIDSIQCTNGTSMAFTLHWLDVLERTADSFHIMSMSLVRTPWVGSFHLKQEGNLLILSLPDDDATVRTSWDEMPLWTYGSNNVVELLLFIPAKWNSQIATTITCKIMIFFIIRILNIKYKLNQFWLEQIHNTKLILKSMKCSPQSGLWIHLTTLTLPVCPFSKVKTRFSWNRTQRHWYVFKYRVPDVHQQVHRATADSPFDK